MDFYAYNAVPAIMNDWLHFSYTRSKPAAEHSYWLIIAMPENGKNSLIFFEVVENLAIKSGY